jgi:thiol-disulfide isomerase/thioredoxin
MKILHALAPLSMIVSISCNQNQDYFRAGSGSGETPLPDPRAKKMWTANLPEAKTRAIKNGKLVFVEFTGSAWCPPCIALHEYVLTQTEFLDYAEQNFELVALDFPRDPSKAPKTLNEIALKYKVEGFPTIIIMEANGKELHRLVGFKNKNSKAYTADLKKALGR